ncbi:MAG: AAA family ATPase [Selenomonas sp.]|uniref:ATP-binding protein n=1 Tax=Selenomonas sp. TaxID=2053611 RepID=UPI0025E5E4FA|nr:AAA family ATPase [Selenomonas sp.]MCR5440046.1 AAA family ATPase [Selenomonas sp.]
MFKRKVYEKLKEWKRNRCGKTALLIEGQRRVGKSTVVEEFAKREYDSYILIDFSTCSKEIRRLFEDISDLDFFFLRLQILTGTNLVERKSLIIFDEVQMCPLARQSIKSLVKDHRFDYIETGSLISIKKNVKDILIPSEEQRIYMYPMDFEEFLWALGDSVTMPLIQKAFQANLSLGDGVHREVMKKMRLYMLVGGMPQAVATYLEEYNFEPVDRIKRDILQLYEDDFYKIDSTGRLTQLFDAIPAQLNKNASRYTVSSVVPQLRPSTSLELIAELMESRTVLVSYHTSQPSSEMASYKNLTKFKLFLSDTGLFTTLMFKNKAFTDNDLYRKLLGDKLPANLGYLYENLIAQCLAAAGYELYYHTFPNKEKTKNYEIDFLIAKGNKICPIEVKSASIKRHASIDAFGKKYTAQIADKYLLGTKEQQKEQDLRILPVYMTSFL